MTALQQHRSSAQAADIRAAAPEICRRRLLLVPCDMTHTMELLHLARAMREADAFEVAFCVGFPGGGDSPIGDAIAEARFAVLDRRAAPEISPQPRPAASCGDEIGVAAGDDAGSSPPARRAMPEAAPERRPTAGRRWSEEYRRRNAILAETASGTDFARSPPPQRFRAAVEILGPYIIVHLLLYFYWKVIRRGMRKAAHLVRRGFRPVWIPRKLTIKLHRGPLIARVVLKAVREESRVRKILTDAKVSLVVFCEDNVEMSTPLWIRAANRLRIPSVIVPYTIANALEPLESYLDSPTHQVDARPSSRIAAWAFPKWTARYKGRHLFRASAERIFQLELLRCSPPNPWIINSGFATAIAAESGAMVAYYRESGIPESKIALTGSLADDAIHAARSERRRSWEKLARHLGLDPARPLLLCAFPPNQLVSRPHPVFADYAALWRGYMETLNRVDRWNVVVRLHPRTSLDQIDRSALGRVALCDWDTASLVPLCELYLATVSATIRWAIACGIPVVNYDVFDYRYSDYVNVESVFTISDHSSFEEQLLRLTGDPAALAAARARQLNAAPSWGLIDGLSRARLVALFDRLVA